jgi:hypothetical protein
MQQISKDLGADRERMEVRNLDISEVWRSFYPELENQETIDIMFKRIERTPEMKFLFEGITAMMAIAFKRLSQVERSVKETAKSERQIENERNKEQLRELFGLNGKEVRAENPIRQLRESFKDYFTDIDDPVEFLKFIRENL